MSQLIPHYKKMSLEQAVKTVMNEEEQKAYLELHNIWVNQRD